MPSTANAAGIPAWAGEEKAIQPSAHAATRTVSASYNGHPVSVTKLATSTQVPGRHITSTVHNAKNGPLAFKDHSPGGASPSVPCR